MATPSYDAHLAKIATLLDVFPIGAALDRLGTQLVTHSEQELDAIGKYTAAVQDAVGANLSASGSAGVDNEMTTLRQGITKHAKHLSDLGTTIASHGVQRQVLEERAKVLRGRLTELQAVKPPVGATHDPIVAKLDADYRADVMTLLSNAQEVRDAINDEESKTSANLDQVAQVDVARGVRDHLAAPAPKPARSR